MTDVTDASQHYSDDGFWKKLKRMAGRLGRGFVLNLLKLFYAAKDPDTPAWAKAVIWGALGYFILPLDAIPDPIVPVGYGDDMSVVAAALATVAIYVKDEHVQRAEAVWRRWFGPAPDEGAEEPPSG